MPLVALQLFAPEADFAHSVTAAAERTSPTL